MLYIWGDFVYPFKKRLEPKRGSFLVYSAYSWSSTSGTSLKIICGPHVIDLTSRVDVSVLDDGKEKMLGDISSRINVRTIYDLEVSDG